MGPYPGKSLAGAYCALNEEMSLSANSLDAAGLAEEAAAAAAAGKMVADTTLGLALARWDLDRLSCPNVHHILALRGPCQLEDAWGRFTQTVQKCAGQLTELLDMRLKRRCIIVRMGTRRTTGVATSASVSGARPQGLHGRNRRLADDA